MSVIFDLEQQLMDCWKVTDDIDMVTKYFTDSPEFAGMDPKLNDELMNKYFAVKELYDLKFENLWKTFEDMCYEYHRCRKIAEQDDWRNIGQ
jgi:hypothetical protein